LIESLQESSAAPAELDRCAWSANLLQPLGRLAEYAGAEVEALHTLPSGAARDAAALNLLLILCATEQVASDCVTGGELDLVAVRSAMRRRKLPDWPLAVLTGADRAVRRRPHAVRRRAACLVADLLPLCLALAEAIASGGDETAAPPDQVAGAFAGLPDELARRSLKIPSCFRAQDLWPEDCFELAARYATGADPRIPITVVGLRTSGSYMAPLCAGWLRGQGFDADYFTVRPKSPLSTLERGLARRPGRTLLLVDDPPMTGSSYLRTAARLEACGASPDRMTFLVPVGAESALSESPESARAFDRYPRIELAHHELHVRRLLESSVIRDWIAFLCGRRADEVEPVFSHDQVTARARRRHVSQVFRVAGRGSVLVKGVGTGWFSYPARLAARALVGYTPAVLGFRGGLMAQVLVEGHYPLGPPATRMADYAAARANRLPLDAPHASISFQKDGWYRLAKVLARVYGPLAPFQIGPLRRRLIGVAVGAPAALVDGRMERDDWISGQELLKADFEEHAFDKDDLGILDPMYDLAGAVLEMGADRADESRLVARYSELTGDEGAADRLPLLKLLHGAFRLERLWWEVVGQRGEPGWSAAVDRWLEAESAATWTLDCLLADAFSAPAVRLHAALSWSLDIDGVLEDGALGFPATTPAAVAAIRGMRRAGATVLLNTGRSLREVAQRCDALHLDGGVAEYGSVVWHGTGSALSLVDTAAEIALERVRRMATVLPDVHSDLRYQSSVRLRRFNGRRLTALAAEDVEALLMSAGPDVRAVHGARQTDFVSVRCDKGLGLVRLLSELGQQGRVISVGDSDTDVATARRSHASYAPRYRDAGLAKVATGLTQDRQMAVLEAVRREHGAVDRRPARPLPAAHALVVELMSLRDRSREVRAAKALGPGALEVFRT